MSKEPKLDSENKLNKSIYILYKQTYLNVNIKYLVCHKHEVSKKFFFSLLAIQWPRNKEKKVIYQGQKESGLGLGKLPTWIGYYLVLLITADAHPFLFVYILSMALFVL